MPFGSCDVSCGAGVYLGLKLFHLMAPRIPSQPADTRSMEGALKRAFVATHSKTAIGVGTQSRPRVKRRPIGISMGTVMADQFMTIDKVITSF